MASRRVVRVRPLPDGTDDRLRAGVAAIEAEMDLPTGFPAGVEEAATRAAASPRLPDLDRTDLALVTVDPPGARDLDQALHLERDPATGGYVVHYAIVDVAAFVSPGDPVDLASHERGLTLYGAGTRIPLHPPALSEEAASLLAGQVRPVLLWTIRLDAAGATTGAQVERARVRSRAQLTYEQVQAAVDDGSAEESLRLLREVGELRAEREAERGGISLPLPEQDVDVAGETWTLELRQQLPAEQWNAQISLLTGFAAAELMAGAGVGLLRTLPPPDPRDVVALRRTARALGVDWPGELEHPEFIRSLDPSQPRHAAMVVACTRLLRGSGYAVVDPDLPEQPGHAALAARYAHATAPLRRLCDRYVGEVCVAICAGEQVADWVLEALAGLPRTMQRAGQRARAYENAVLDLVEAGLLAHRVGELFDGVVIDLDRDEPTKGTVTIAAVATEAPVVSGTELPLGDAVRVRLAAASIEERSLRFEVVEAEPST